MEILLFGVCMLIASSIMVAIENKKLNPTDEEFNELKKAKLIPESYVDFKSLKRKEKKQVRFLTRDMRISYAFVQKCKQAQKQDN